MMTPDCLVDVSDDRGTTSDYNVFMMFLFVTHKSSL
jgi:hypothetical protein